MDRGARRAVRRASGVIQTAAESPVLEVRGLSKHFGSLHVTRDVSLSLATGARCALIGPNGAGKTTLINLIAGRLQQTA